MSPGEAPPKDLRLFSASTATGSFKVEEVDNFDQSDLNDKDVFLLDTFNQVCTKQQLPYFTIFATH